MPTCAALYCYSREWPGCRLTFHRFPLERPSINEQWLQNVRRPDWMPSDKSVLCSAHFEEACFNVDATKALLHPDAVPTKFTYTRSAKMRTKPKKVLMKLPRGYEHVIDEDRNAGDARHVSPPPPEDDCLFTAQQLQLLDEATDYLVVMRRRLQKLCERFSRFEMSLVIKKAVTSLTKDASDGERNMSSTLVIGIEDDDDDVDGYGEEGKVNDGSLDEDNEVVNGITGNESREDEDKDDEDGGKEEDDNGGDDDDESAKTSELCAPKVKVLMATKKMRADKAALRQREIKRKISGSLRKDKPERVGKAKIANKLTSPTKAISRTEQNGLDEGLTKGGGGMKRKISKPNRPTVTSKKKKKKLTDVDGERNVKRGGAGRVVKASRINGAAEDDVTETINIPDCVLGDLDETFAPDDPDIECARGVQPGTAVEDLDVAGGDSAVPAIPASQFTCSLCGLALAKRSTFLKHLIQHAGDSLDCPVCGKRCESDVKLAIHASTHARGSRSSEQHHVCPICGKTMKDNFERHMQTHSDERAVICDVCGLTFKCRDTLTKHRVVHRPSKDFRCDRCSKRFVGDVGLRNHMAIHAGGQFACESCGRAFLTRAHLRRHASVHSGEADSVEKPGSGDDKRRDSKAEVAGEGQGTGGRKPRTNKVTPRSAISDVSSVDDAVEHDRSSDGEPAVDVKVEDLSDTDQPAADHDVSVADCDRNGGETIVAMYVNKRVTGVTAADDVQYQCFMCLETFLNTDELESHFLRAHGRAEGRGDE